MPRTLRNEVDAVGQVVAFLAAGVIFLGATGAILVASRSGGSNDHGTREADRQTQADSLADLLASSPGVGWASGNDNVARLGLRAANGSGLQESSLDAMRGALFMTAANGKVDYDDARESLGLTGMQDFHLRVYPVGMASVYKAADSRQRTAYIGDWQSLPALTVPVGTPATKQANAQSSLNASMVAATASERQALRHLGLNFVDQVYIGAGSPNIVVPQIPLGTLPLLTDLNLPYIDGGVYPDIKSYLDANLAARLPNYDLLIVGSGVDQASMTSAAVKNTIRDWVLAGGTLVVLGTANLNYQWLQPLVSTGVRTANGAATAPDPTHPLLREPHLLDWQRYNSHNVGWQPATGFSHVIVKGGQDVLAISDDGAFGAGRIILTTYQPREVATGIGQREAEDFIENVVLFTDHSHLYLEYGPTQPDLQPVSVAVRQSHLYDPVLGQVPVRLEVHFWGHA
ncbi:MAG TPA: hypothetical protein VM241_08920 [Candidatus Thermoplasmatota archaeon]|nr:hypothetical protein [Candidatus Thermoplasmatota archaeon]